MDPFERLSDEAQRALTLAHEESGRARRAYIGTEHILLGLLGVPGSLAATVLAELGVDLAVARAGIDSVAAPSGRFEILGDAVPTSRVRRVIELAFGEAQRVHAGAVSSGALLVGLLLEVDGLGSHVLGDRGVTVDTVREALRRLAEAGLGEAGRPRDDETPP